MTLEEMKLAAESEINKILAAYQTDANVIVVDISLNVTGDVAGEHVAGCKIDVLSVGGRDWEV